MLNTDTASRVTGPRRFARGAFADLERLARRKRQAGTTVTVILPARQVAETIGTVLTELSALRRPVEADAVPLVDQVVVVASDGDDGTADIARGFDAEVYLESDLMPGYGPNLGKGDALWRGLSVAEGDLVAFADTDSRDFRPELVAGILGPMLTDPGIRFTKGAFRRPFARHDVVDEDAGGRVTEIAAKPLLNVFFPELAGFAQPLAGEFAGHRSLLRSLPFVTGYGVDVGLLIDAAARGGVASLAEVDLGGRINRHQSLTALSRMGYAVARTILDRAGTRSGAAGRFIGDGSAYTRFVHAAATPRGLLTTTYHEPLIERPPLDTLGPEGPQPVVARVR
ncbi:glucosyl-3-phosphoglycerate synthase [Streptomyces pactum]|uniref:Glucosyl-3-phosphoglycerate synthase n=1 Tax=Streptomyces pactum TaxID=68249 RepID=A0ABS0NE99_9ACTN|nr:glucosyl-3-phosphoglycerate synthase [Streptomyces pactum]MBH5333523.1 glucosyl-3-phosphoglycerate synthase [Streptomyces pactum]